MNVPEFLACPECHAEELAWSDALPPSPAPFDSREGLVCRACGRCFPRVDGVWVLWTDQVKALQYAAPEADAPIADRVRWANLQIYDQVSDAYGEHCDDLHAYRETILFLKALADDLQTPAPERARVQVDVGCAQGVGLEIGPQGYTHRVGVDLSLQNLRAVARKGFIAVLGDAGALPFRAGAIDMITCFAALHHFPEPAAFMRSAHACLRDGGVLVTGGDPSRRYGHLGPLARLVWEARKPVYRTMSRVSGKFFLHRDRRQQQLGDLAEYQRTGGGFSPDALAGALLEAGFPAPRVFHGVDPGGRTRFAAPPWKVFMLKALSLQNPWWVKNWVNLSTLARKGEASQAAER
ncbi:MAG: methyltransferase domain-containing protein [Myxococcales bacterium]|nr:methyltransferase domain-containing protein [Myxococcales bacterium]